MIKISIYQNNKKILGGITNIEEDKVKEIIDSERPITTTINSSSTDTEIPSAKSVYDKYNIHDKSEAYSNIITNPLYVDVLNADSRYNKDGIVSRDTAEDLTTFTFPIDCSWGIREIFWKSEYNLVNKITGMDLNNKPGTWINVLRGDASTHTWSGWQRLCTTSVADVSKIAITWSDITYFKSNDVVSTGNYYQVKNGICYVNIDMFCISPKNGGYTLPITLPRPSLDYVHVNIASLPSGTYEHSSVIMAIFNSGNSVIVYGGKANDRYLGSFSYPVAES